MILEEFASQFKVTNCYNTVLNRVAKELKIQL